MSLPDAFSTPRPASPLAVLDQVVDWVRADGVWWASSFVFHMLLVCAVMLAAASWQQLEDDSEIPAFEEAQVEQQTQAPPEIERFDPAHAPLDPSELTPESLSLTQPPGVDEKETVKYDDDPVFTERGGGRPDAVGPQFGGLGGFDAIGIGPGVAAHGPGGVGGGLGTGTSPGSGGSGIGFGGRGTGMRKAGVGGFGGTKGTERAVAAALSWLARHQFPDGRWSLDRYGAGCKHGDSSCGGSAVNSMGPASDTAATAFGLLPFLAAGQTQDVKGPYRETVRKGLRWLMMNEAPDGNLALNAPGNSKMYAQGLAAITLCEAYGMTKNEQLRDHAQRAVQFIEAAQHPGGGWRYSPGQPGDTSVTGWQIMALKSAQMAGLSVDTRRLDLARDFLRSVSSGQYGGLFTYQPTSVILPGQGSRPVMSGGSPTMTMTSVGLLCSQYLGTKRDSPVMEEGIAYLLQNLPGTSGKDTPGKDIYCWYYATQAMHNVPGPEWDQWNRKMRKVLIDSQEKRDCCAMGSWDPSGDRWAARGGRVMSTSLSALTLEVYYRYLPLYQLDAEVGAANVIKAPADEKKGAEKKADSGKDGEGKKPELPKL